MSSLSIAGGLAALAMLAANGYVSRPGYFTAYHVTWNPPRGAGQVRE